MAPVSQPQPNRTARLSDVIASANPPEGHRCFLKSLRLLHNIPGIKGKCIFIRSNSCFSGRLLGQVVAKTRWSSTKESIRLRRSMSTQIFTRVPRHAELPVHSRIEVDAVARCMYIVAPTPRVRPALMSSHVRMHVPTASAQTTRGQMDRR